MAENIAPVLKQTSQNNTTNVSTRGKKLSYLKSVYSNLTEQQNSRQDEPDLLQFIYKIKTDPTTHFPS
jgi:hypothetical protein